MKKRFLAFALWTALLLALLPGCDKQEKNRGKPVVQTTVWPLYDFARRIAGDKAEVALAVPRGAEAHHWEPKASDLTAWAKSDVFVYNGLGMEPWVDRIRADKTFANLIWVCASDGIEAETHENEPDETDKAHEHADPHVWLSPVKAEAQMRNITEALANADPANRDYYETNFARAAERLRALHRAYAETAKTARNRYVVVSHAAFGHMCEEYGLVQVAAEGLDSHSEPSPARIKEIIDLVRARNIRTVFKVPGSAARSMDTVAAETGAAAAALDPMESPADDAADYFALAEQNLEALKQALD